MQILLLIEQKDSLQTVGKTHHWADALDSCRCLPSCRHGLCGLTSPTWVNYSRVWDNHIRRLVPYDHGLKSAIFNFPWFSLRNNWIIYRCQAAQCHGCVLGWRGWGCRTYLCPAAFSPIWNALAAMVCIIPGVLMFTELKNIIWGRVTDTKQAQRDLSQVSGPMWISRVLTRWQCILRSRTGRLV